MSAPEPIILRSREMCALVGVSGTTWRKWTLENKALRACKFRRGYWRVAQVKKVLAGGES
jgi:hypothetical protein